MPFSSLSDFLTETQINGKHQTTPFYRVVYTSATSVAGRWHECFSGAGTGGTGVLSGSAGIGTVFNSSTTGALPLNGSVGADKRCLTSMVVTTNGTTVAPSWVLLTDVLYSYPSCVVTGTPTTIDNTAAKPSRYGTGVGVVCSGIVTGGVALGAAQPNLTITYTEAGGTPPGAKTFVLAASANSLPAGSFLAGATASTVLGGAFGAWATQDVGIQQLDSYVINSGSTTGVVSFVLHRPIAYIPLIVANASSERDYISQTIKLPEIKDDACLAFFILVGGATTAGNLITGEINYGWG